MNMEQKRTVEGRDSTPETPTKPSKKKAKLDCDKKSTVPITVSGTAADQTARIEAKCAKIHQL